MYDGYHHQIANVVFDKVDAGAVGTAVAGDTLFIHGRTVEGGGRLSSHRKLAAEEASGSETWCEPSCGDADAAAATNLPDGVSTACDASCGVENRFGGYLCGAGDSQKFGGSCRLCYTDQEAALRAEAELRKMDDFYAEGDAEARHVVMCDTMRPPSALGCSSECADKKDTVRVEQLFSFFGYTTCVMHAHVRTTLAGNVRTDATEADFSYGQKKRLFTPGCVQGAII